VSIQVKTAITRYQPLINRPERNSLSSGPLHAISIKSGRFSWPREFLSIVLMLFIEENCLSHSAVDGQRIKVETQLFTQNIIVMMRPLWHSTRKILHHVGCRDIFILHHMLKYSGNPTKTHPQSNTTLLVLKI